MLAPRAQMQCSRWRARLLCVIACVGLEGTAGSADFDAELETSAYADSDHVSVLTPAVHGTLSDAASGISASGSYVVDIVSAASVDIVSTASRRWTEVRHAADVGVDYKPSDIGVRLGGGVSREPDYLSWSLGGTARVELDDDHVTPMVGYAFSHDTAGRTGTPYDVYALRLARHTAQAGVELVLSRSSRLILLAEAAFESGRQEKPYRLLPLFSDVDARSIARGSSIDRVNALRLPGRVSERVPESRQRYTVTANWAVRGERATLRLDERLYADSWGLLASTSDARWLWDASARVTLGPHARFHVQSSVDFWQRAYVGELLAGELFVPELRSGDRELSALWTGSLGFGAEWRTHALQAQGWVMGGAVELSLTRFLDALFIEQRSAALGVLTLGRAF